MNNKKIIMSVCIVFSFFVSISVISIATFNSYLTKAGSTEYSLKCNSGKNKFHNSTTVEPMSGSASLQTEMGYSTNFTYSNIIGGGASTWHVLSGTNSYFYNSDQIRGLNSITLNFKTSDKTFKIYWSNTAIFGDGRCQEYTSSSSTPTICCFNDFEPNYVRVENTSGSNLNISSVTYNYSCTNKYFKLSRTSEDTRMGTVSGNAGLNKIGSSVTINAVANKGCTFLGWYDGSALISNDSDYTFTMPGYDVNYVAKFIGDNFNLAVSSNDETKGTVSGSGTYAYLSSVTATATPNEGYKFIGWYSGETFLSEKLLYKFEMPNKNYSIVGKFTEDTFNVSVSSNNEEWGTVSGNGNYLFNSSITLKATPTTGYSFVGWYDGDTLISSEAEYTFNMPAKNLTYVGKFIHTVYKLTVTSDNEEKGTVTGSGDYYYQDEVTLVATPKQGCVFNGWYIGDTLLSTDLSYTYTMPLDNVIIIGKFAKIYSLYIDSDDTSKGTVECPFTAPEGSKVTLTARPTEGNALNYWYNDDFEDVSHNRVYEITMPSNDLTLHANFVTGGYKVDVKKFFGSGSGTVDGDYNYLPNTQVTLIANPNQESITVVWYKDTIRIENNIFEFLMASKKVIIDVSFYTQDDISFGTAPYVVEYGKTLTYGLYPQTHIKDPEQGLIDAGSGKADEEYFVYNNEYYVKDIGTPDSTVHRESFKFYDGTIVQSGVTYYFKCEPITWDIVGTGTNYTIECSNVLYNHRFAESSNVYANSELRTWLNEDLYKKAFSLKTTSSYIVPTSLSDVGVTNDNVWIDLKSESGWYKKQKKVSDFAMCNGCDSVSNSSSYYYRYCSDYWTRTPISFASNQVWTVRYDGEIVSGSSASASYVGVSPSLTIKKD